MIPTPRVREVGTSPPGQVGAKLETSWCTSWCLGACTATASSVPNVAQATEIQVVLPDIFQWPISGFNFMWVGQRSAAGDFIQVGYFVASNDTTHAHPFYAYFPPRQGDCILNYCQYFWHTSYNAGEWHEFWQSSSCGGYAPATCWGFYVDDWTNALGCVSTQSSDSGQNPATAILEANGAGSGNNFFPATEYYYALEYFQSGAWTVSPHADVYRSPDSSCPEESLRLRGQNDLKLGTNLDGLTGNLW